MKFKTKERKKCIPGEFYKIRILEQRSDKNCPHRRGYLDSVVTDEHQRFFFYVLSLCDLKVKGLRQREWELEQREPSTRSA